MSATASVREVEVPIRGTSGGGIAITPPPDGGDGRDDRGGSPRKPPQKRFSTAIALAMISILMFFLVPSVALIVLERTSETWVPLRLPRILLLNTGVLLASSYTLEAARRRLHARDFRAFHKLWNGTTTLGFLFLAGQLIAWVQLVTTGIYIASTQASSFFYILTGAHGAHLLGGIAALCYVALNDFEKGKISRITAVKIISYYWHFMDGLWVFLLSLLYLFH
jgi:cytochrome c oxidase subunit III